MERRAVPLTLDKPRTLKYTYGALRWLKDNHGLVVGSLDQMAEDWTLYSPWLCAGLRHEDDTLTVERMDELIPMDPEGLNTLLEKIGEAIGLGFASDVPEGEGDGNPPSTGSNSIGSPMGQSD